MASLSACSKSLGGGYVHSVSLRCPYPPWYVIGGGQTYTVYTCGNSKQIRFRLNPSCNRSKGVISPTISSPWTFKIAVLACRLLDRYYLPALFSRGGKIFTLAAAAGLAVLGGFGLPGLQMGLEPQLAAPTDFYLQVNVHSVDPPSFFLSCNLPARAAPRPLHTCCCF